MRQFLFDAWHLPMLKALAGSTDRRVAEIAEKAAKEAAYHLERSTDLVVRLGDGTDESHARMQAALDLLWPYAGEMFLGDAVDAELAAAGIAPAPESLRPAWDAHVGRDARRRDADAGPRAASCRRAASAASIPSISASSWPRCSSCSAPIPARAGERTMAETLEKPSTETVWSWLAEVPDPEIPVISVVDLGIVRDVRLGRRHAGGDGHADLFRLPGHQRHQLRDRPPLARARRRQACG